MVGHFNEVFIRIQSRYYVEFYLDMHEARW